MGSLRLCYLNLHRQHGATDAVTTPRVHAPACRHSSCAGQQTRPCFVIQDCLFQLEDGADAASTAGC